MRRVTAYQLLALAGPGVRISTLHARFAERYRERLDIFELPFEARGFTPFAAWPPSSQADPAHVWLSDTLAGLAANQGAGLGTPAAGLNIEMTYDVAPTATSDMASDGRTERNFTV
ncbi:hypothetical protein [Caballeronia sp. dw_19]|uniref:hypothetical protein n=1 Tax=Caballeronia sp. dw_19 TaxID=2719791 RepID=UPI001BD4C75C|nr:hypothetical protein [Caballeronia sp. dw_19]